MLKKYGFLFLLLSTSPAFAQAPTLEEQLSHDKIQFGQLLIQLGNAELEIAKLKKELADTKPKPEAEPH